MFNYFDLTSTTDYEYLLSAMGTDVLINGETVRTLVTNTNLEQNYDDKRISSLTPFKRGDLIEFDDKQWMIISEEASKRYGKWKGIMRLLPHTITFNASCVFISVPAFIETQSLGVESGQIMTIADGQLYVNVPDNEEIRNIKVNDRFIKYGLAFKVVGIDRFSKEGIAIVTCEKDSISPYDDVTNDIAGGLACSVEITNPEPIEVYEGQTLQLTWNSNNAPVVFISSDESIATVDASGLVTGVSVGQVTIIIQNATNEFLRDSVTVNIIEEPASYSIQITSGSSTPIEIKYGQSKTYNAEVYNGATLIVDGSQPVSWQLFADDKVSNTTLANITSQNGTSCTIKNNNANSGYVQLRAMLQSDNSIVAWYRIQMKPLF
ncbi:Ig-like domain-containing protein [Paenibacillus thermotolerans]|uniref:Ig-like domain-containing protein n=1 Tax=Paenibacillus thermotolerans TaxID=3027807 RepID=UPI00236803CE|nr:MULTISPECIES: Ig-like domain-containing protein [unclassified Paenibacillus]